MINYFSTNQPQKKVSLEDAILNGLPADKGLYIPDSIPVIDPLLTNQKHSLQRIAIEISKHFLQPTFTLDEVERIINEAINFEVPIHFLEQPYLSVGELFHGPTGAFKDFGARFMSRVLGALVSKKNKKITILVATSGDTGGAIGRGFLNVPNTKVVILYPSKKVSPLQEKQITTLGNNITALEVDGTFDDCQQLVKTAFVDKALNSTIHLVSANSINISRLIPQSFYYAYMSSQLFDRTKQDISFCIPSGNFGNLTAGYLAKKMGFRIGYFIGAVNANRVFADFLESGVYKPKPSLKTISNAMDVGSPNNFDRLSYYFNHRVASFKAYISSYSVNDDQTREAIKEVFDQYGYIIDPHTAVGYVAYKMHHKHKPTTPCSIVSTAHPAKFFEVVEDILDQEIEKPSFLTDCLSKTKQSIYVSNAYDEVKARLSEIAL